MSNEQTQSLIESYSLAERDIQVQLLHTGTALRAGSSKCGSMDRDLTEECCATYEHAGRVKKYYNYYYCDVDTGTGDWD